MIESPRKGNGYLGKTPAGMVEIKPILNKAYDKTENNDYLPYLSPLKARKLSYNGKSKNIHEMN